MRINSQSNFSPNDTRFHSIKDDIETWGGWALSILSRVDHPIIQKLLCCILWQTVQVDGSRAREAVDLSILNEFYKRGEVAARVPLADLDLGAVAFDQAKNFVKMMECVNRIADLAEAEGHHPDLHLTGYRNLKIELTTHAIGGLSENDFILAAKIDALLAEQESRKPDR